MRRKAGATLLCMALLGAFAGSPMAQAQSAAPQRADAKVAAIVSAEQGQALFNAGRYEEALSAFRDADQKFPAPTIKLMIARTHVSLGQLRKGQHVYQEITAEQLAHYAPQVFFDAQAEAKKELEALAPRIPTLEVQVRGASALDVEVAIDGDPALLGDPTAQDPGDHTVTATAPGYQTTTQLVDLKEGAAVKVTLEMKALAAPVPSRGILPAVPAQPADARAPAASGENDLVMPAIAAFGAAGFALALGGVTLGLAATERSTLSPQCRATSCGGDTADRVATLETAATVSFVASGLLAVGGVGLLLAGHYSSPRQAKTTLVAGPGWLSVRGTF